MQIPATSSASQAASIVAQAASKDGHAEAQQAGAAGMQQAANAAVEKSSAASPDRDAQGQGDGLPGERKKSLVDELEISLEENATEHLPAPQLPGQPPSQLDIIG